uniref:Uncharacterized protein n=1 Tax=Phlebotomus papatasi TaxID=29031 RepID=A0A1B0DKP3_PHLPP
MTHLMFRRGGIFTVILVFCHGTHVQRKSVRERNISIDEPKWYTKIGRREFVWNKELFQNQQPRLGGVPGDTRTTAASRAGV